MRETRSFLSSVSQPMTESPVEVICPPLKIGFFW
jgi:hypothetical protein